MSSLPTRELAADPRVVRGMKTQLARRRELIAAGERPLGWKLGFGAPAAMERLGTPAPLVGFLMASGLVQPRAAVSLAGWTNPALEPEVAVHMAREQPAGADRRTTETAISALGPAFELADVSPPPSDVEQILAGNIFQRAVMLGPKLERRSLEGVCGRVVVNGSPTLVENPQTLTGELVDLVRHVADLLVAFDERLAAGDVVICGSIVPPIEVAAGDQVAYELGSTPPLLIRLEA